MNEIVVGYDGSACADLAIDLVGGMPWDDTSIRIVTAVPDLRAIRSAWGPLALADRGDIDRVLVLRGEELLKPPLERLRRRGLTCATSVLVGRPASVIAEEAARRRARLVVVGSRGLGPIRSTVLGSVSTELIDVVESPVLVARAASVSSIMFATDGSEGAATAGRTLASLPVARTIPVRVVSVSDHLRPWMLGIAPTLYLEALAAEAEDEARAREIHLEIAEEAAARLRDAGVAATAEVASGDPASTLIDRAESTGSDLIVLGTRGRTGLTRLLLGSVARRVVQHARASVLVVREGDGTQHNGEDHESGRPRAGRSGAARQR